jgi:hypothetical protein
VIGELKERSKRRNISPTIIAFIYMGLREKDQAFAWLDKAYEGRDSMLVSYSKWSRCSTACARPRASPPFCGAPASERLKSSFEGAFKNQNCGR